MRKPALDGLSGMYAPRAYAAIFDRLPDVQAVSFGAYAVPLLIQDRASLSARELDLVRQAAEHRTHIWFSYLEILLELSAKAECPVPGILNAIEYHQPHPAKRTWLSRDDLRAGRLESLCSGNPSNRPLAVYSRVRTVDARELHVPLLDFRVEKSHRSAEIAMEIARRLTAAPFVFFETARSYHMVALELLSPEAMTRFLAKSLLFSPIVDHAYVAHQLLEGEAALRITARDDNDLPRVIAVSV